MKNIQVKNNKALRENKARDAKAASAVFTKRCLGRFPLQNTSLEENPQLCTLSSYSSLKKVVIGQQEPLKNITHSPPQRQ